MNITRLALSAILLATAVMPAFSQDFDDIYYNANTAKAKAERKAQKATLQQQRYVLIESSGEDYAPADSYSPSGRGLNMSVDEYNRRGIFANDTIQAPDSAAIAGDFAYTQRIQRFHNPSVVSSDEEVAQYISSQQPVTNVNIYVNDPGYYGYWGVPYGYDPYWYGSSWAWGWGPSWSWRWGWGPSWSWSWGWGGPGWGWSPSWSWSWGWGGPGWGWGGPAWIPSQPVYGMPGRQGVYTHNPRGNGNGRPASGLRPGVSSGASYRPSADGYRPGSGVYPGYGNSGARPGAAATGVLPGTSASGSRPGTATGTNNSGSYSRPGRGGGNSSYSRPGSSSSSGRSGGSFGGGSRSGGGSSRTGGGSHGGRH